MIITLFYTEGDIFKAVKEDSSHLAERTKDSAGASLFDDIVYDEEYMINFKRVFLQAQSNIIEQCINYIKTLPYGAEYVDNQNFDSNKDFVLQFDMPENFAVQASRIIDTRIRTYLVAYILYTWLKDKLPNVAGIYYSELEELLSGISFALNMRVKPTRTRGSLYE